MERLICGGHFVPQEQCCQRMEIDTEENKAKRPRRSSWTHPFFKLPFGTFYLAKSIKSLVSLSAVPLLTAGVLRDKFVSGAYTKKSPGSLGPADWPEC